MNWIEMLTKIFEVCVIPMLGILTMYIVNFIKAKNMELTKKIDNELADKYINRIAQTITDCVIATNQTYVDSLKSQGKFDAEAQKTAFNTTYKTILGLLTEEAKAYIVSMYGDVEAYISNKIEAEVNALKIEK